MTELLNSFKAHRGMRFRSIEQFLAADWKGPFVSKNSIASIRGLFNEKREKAANRREGVKFSASQFLIVFPLIRKLAENIEGDDVAGNCKSWYALCDVADSLQAAKRQHYSDQAVMAQRLKDLVDRYLAVRMAVYGKNDVKPKHHMMLHISEQFREDGVVLDCWVLERMHLLIKRFSDVQINTAQYEKSVIIRAVVDRTRMLQSKNTSDRLLGSSSPSAELKTNVGRHLALSTGQEFHCEDFVFSGEDL